MNHLEIMNEDGIFPKNDYLDSDVLFIEYNIMTIQTNDWV